MRCGLRRRRHREGPSRAQRPRAGDRDVPAGLDPEHHPDPLAGCRARADRPGGHGRHRSARPHVRLVGSTHRPGRPARSSPSPVPFGMSPLAFEVHGITPLGYAAFPFHPRRHSRQLPGRPRHPARDQLPARQPLLAPPVDRDRDLRRPRPDRLLLLAAQPPPDVRHMRAKSKTVPASPFGPQDQPKVVRPRLTLSLW
jgi:hypothetical protein